MRISLLDFGDLDTLEIAAAADDLGFSRIWLAEHQSPTAVYADALLMSMAVGAVTRRAQIGPGGVLLRFRSPLSIANAARLLDSIYPGRIDVGLAAGSTNEPERKSLLDGRSDYASRAEHRERVRITAATMRGLAPCQPAPDTGVSPVTWYLDSSGAGAVFAGQFGLGYALSLIHSPTRPSPDAIEAYRNAFVPSKELPQAAALVALGVHVDALGPPSVRTGATIHNPIAGAFSECERSLRLLVNEYDVDEVMILELSGEIGNRMAALEKFSRAWQLQEPEAFAVGSQLGPFVPPGSQVWLTRADAEAFRAAHACDQSVHELVLPNGWRSDVARAEGTHVHYRLLTEARALSRMSPRSETRS